MMMLHFSEHKTIRGKCTAKKISRFYECAIRDCIFISSMPLLVLFFHYLAEITATTTTTADDGDGDDDDGMFENLLDFFFVWEPEKITSRGM